MKQEKKITFILDTTRITTKLEQNFIPYLYLRDGQKNILSHAFKISACKIYDYETVSNSKVIQPSEDDGYGNTSSLFLINPNDGNPYNFSNMGIIAFEVEIAKTYTDLDWVSAVFTYLPEK